MTKYDVRYSQEFKKSLKKVTKQGKNINKLMPIITSLANKEKLDSKFIPLFVEDRGILWLFS